MNLEATKHLQFFLHMKSWGTITRQSWQSEHVLILTLIFLGLEGMETLWCGRIITFRLGRHSISQN